jgi:hypothetical protein
MASSSPALFKEKMYPLLLKEGKGNNMTMAYMETSLIS